jgi:IS1 family transposase
MVTQLITCYHCESEGQTSHVERWNNTSRQRLSRFVGKTLSFSNSEEMHEVCV